MGATIIFFRALLIKMMVRIIQKILHEHIFLYLLYGIAIGKLEHIFDYDCSQHNTTIKGWATFG